MPQIFKTLLSAQQWHLEKNNFSAGSCLLGKVYLKNNKNDSSKKEGKIQKPIKKRIFQRTCIFL